MTTMLRDLIRRLRCEDGGAAITEFVITLPIFVLSFVAILHLHGISDFAARGKAAAYADALEDWRYMQTSYTPFDWSISPLTGGGRAAIWHNKVSASHPRDRAADLVLDPIPVAGGHMLESWSRIAVSGPPDWAAETVKLKEPKAFATMEGLLNGAPPSTSPVSGNIRLGYSYSGETDSVFTVELFDDLAGLPGSSGKKGYMNFMNQALGAGGIRPAIAAGMRYGVVEGEFDETQPWMRRSYTVQQDTHLAAVPRPTSKWITLGMIRMYLASDEAYDKSILAFEMSVNTGDPEAQAAKDCQSKLEGVDLSASGIVSSIGVFKDISGGDPCGGGGGGSDPLGFITGPLSTVGSFFGGTSVPTNTSTGTVGQEGSFP